MIIRAKIAQRSPLSIAVNLCAFVEKYFHRLATEDFQRELVAHGVHILNRTADDGAFSWGARRQGIQARRSILGRWSGLRGNTLCGYWAREGNPGKGRNGKHQ
jgi:hypothetical protein